MADWELWLHDVRTGAPIEQLWPTEEGCSWSTSRSGDGESTLQFVVGDDGIPGDVIADTFRTNERMIVRWWGSFCMYAHKIDRWEYDDDAGTVTVSAVDLWIETEWRMIGPVDTDKLATLTVSNRSASGAIAAVLYRMMQWGWEWEYPIDLPADAPGDFSGSWPFWKKLRISDIIKEIQDATGVEVYLRPYDAGGRTVRFQTRVAPAITIGSSSFNLSADESPLGGIRYTVDGATQVTGVLGVGNGSGQDQETGAGMRSSSDITTIPIRDTKKTFDGLTGQALQNAAVQYMRANIPPVRQLSVGTFTVTGDWSPEDAGVGRSWVIDAAGHPVIPDSILRVIRVSGDNSRQLKMEVQGGS